MRIHLREAGTKGQPEKWFVIVGRHVMTYKDVPTIWKTGKGTDEKEAPAPDGFNLGVMEAQKDYDAVLSEEAAHAELMVQNSDLRKQKWELR